LSPLAAVDDEDEDEAAEEDGDDEDDGDDLAPSLGPPSPFAPAVADFCSDEPEDSEPDEAAEDLAAFRLSVL
jgi:hypothetical protein